MENEMLIFIEVSTFFIGMFVAASANLFIFMLCEKWKVFEKLQMKAKRDFFNKLFSCKFCLTFWINVFVSTIFILFFMEYYLLFLYFVTPGFIYLFYNSHDL